LERGDLTAGRHILRITLRKQGESENWKKKSSRSVLNYEPNHGNLLPILRGLRKTCRSPGVQIKGEDRRIKKRGKGGRIDDLKGKLPLPRARCGGKREERR